MGPGVSDEAYQAWGERLQVLAEDPKFAELREARGLFPMSRFGDDFDNYVKKQVGEFKELAEEVGLSQ